MGRSRKEHPGQRRLFPPGLPLVLPKRQPRRMPGSGKARQAARRIGPFLPGLADVAAIEERRRIGGELAQNLFRHGLISKTSIQTNRPYVNGKPVKVSPIEEVAETFEVLAGIPGINVQKLAYFLLREKNYSAAIIATRIDADRFFALVAKNPEIMQPQNMTPKEQRIAENCIKRWIVSWLNKKRYADERAQQYREKASARWRTRGRDERHLRDMHGQK